MGVLNTFSQFSSASLPPNRQQLQDLDGITQRLRLRLSCEDSDIDANQPASARSADILTGTHSGLSTIHTTSSLTATREVLSDVSRQLLATTADTSQQRNGSTSEDNTSHNAVDSGAFSGNNTGKSQEVPDSQRSDKQEVFAVASAVSAGLQSALPVAGEEMGRGVAQSDWLTAVFLRGCLHT